MGICFSRQVFFFFALLFQTLTPFPSLFAYYAFYNLKYLTKNFPICICKELGLLITQIITQLCNCVMPLENYTFFNMMYEI